MDANQAIDFLENNIQQTESEKASSVTAELEAIVDEQNFLAPDPKVKEDDRGFLKRTADWFKGGQRDSTIPTIAEMALGNSVRW